MRFEEIARITTRKDENVKREVIISYNNELKKYQILQDEIKVRDGVAMRYHMGASICLDKEALTMMKNALESICNHS